MHRRLCTYALSGFLTLGLAAGTLFAQENATSQSQTQTMPMRRHHRMSSERQLHHMDRTLHLTADQQAQLKPILEARQKEMRGVWRDHSLTRQQRREKLMDIRQDYTGKIEAVLNDTQKKKYGEMMENMRDRRMHRGMGQGSMGQGSMGQGSMGQGTTGRSTTPPPSNSSQPPQ